MKAILMSLVLFCGMNASAQSYNVRESIMGYMPRMSGIDLKVYSGGCTRKEDFRFEVENLGAVKKITVFRTRPDECYAFLPSGVVLQFSFAELGLSSGDIFFVGNSIQTGRVL